MVDEPDSNRRPTAFAVALPLSYRPLSKHRLATRGIRGGKAVRTGREFKNPYRCKSSIDVSHWRLAAPIRYATAPCCRPYRSIQARRFRAFAAFPASDQHCPDASGRDAIAFDLSGFPALRTAKTRRPRCWTEGVRLPREIGVTDLPRAGDQSMGSASSRLPRSDGASAHRPWPDGRSAYSLAMSLKCVMDEGIKKTLTRERRPRTLRR